MRALVRLLSVPTAVGMFLVLVMGAAVTNTGSAEGCGRSWPLCHGQFVPELATATLIEYSHRAVTGVEGLLVAALGIGAWRAWPRRDVRALVLLMVGTLLLQAGMGAWAVLYPQTPLVLATHFGISLLCFAATFLLVGVLRRQGGLAATPRAAAPDGYRRAAWGLMGFTLLVVYLGAYTRHTNAHFACLDWPLCNGQVVPPLSGLTGIVFAHRVAALLLGLGLAGLAVGSRPLRASRPDLYQASWWAFGLVALQTLVGALLVFTQFDLFSALAHAAVMALLFAALSYLCFQTLPAAQPARRDRPSPQPGPLPLPASPRMPPGA